MMDDSEAINKIVNVLIQEANTDSIGLWTILWELEEHCGILNKNEKRRLTLQVVGKLLENKMLVMDFFRGRGWKCWPDQSPNAVCTRIELEWDALGHEPVPGDICWFNLPGRIREDLCQ